MNNIYTYIIKDKNIIELLHRTTGYVWEIKELKEVSFQDNRHIYYKKFNASLLRTQKWIKENHPELLI